MLTANELEQYILLQAMDKIVKADVEQRSENPYKNLILINGVKPEATFNKILSCEKDVYDFWTNLTDLQKSFLVPKIELFYRTEKGYEPVLFRMYPDFNQAKNFALNRSGEFDAKENPREDGGGIKSISISNRAERPSDVNIEAKLELFFDNETALYSSNILQLIRTPPQRTHTESRDYRLRLVCGWHMPVDASQRVFSPKQLEIIQKSNVVYLLELVTHNYELRENGSINLTIEYQGALEKYLSISSEMDIFSLKSPEQKQLFLYGRYRNSTSEAAQEDAMQAAAPMLAAFNDDFEKNFEQVRVQNDYLKSYQYLSTSRTIIEVTLSSLYKQQQELNKNTKSQNGQVVDSSLEEKIKVQEKNLEFIKKRMDEIEMYVTTRKYQKLLQAILDTDGMSVIKIPQAIFNTILSDSTQSVNGFLDTLVLLTMPIIKPEKITQRQRYVGGSYTKKFKNIKEQMINLQEYEREIDNAKTDEERKQISEEFLKELSEKEADTYEQLKESKDKLAKYKELLSQLQNNNGEIGTYLPDKIQTTQKSIDNLESGDKYIHYTTLGDIINAAATLVEFEPDVNLVLGPAKLGNKIINLCQFPISLRSFQIWFVDNVIKKSKRSYYFWEFIQDIFKNLVTPNLISSRVISKQSLNLNVQVTSIVSDVKLERGKSYLDTDVNVVNALSPNVFNYNDIYTYLIIYIYDYQMESRKGDIEEDYKDGIYHYYKSMNKGIIKTINFTKIDFPRYRDMRITNNKFNDTGDILREHYNASITAIGCPLFTNGGHIYLNATSLGVYGERIISDLGLSGYYMITGIDHTFSTEKGYEMKIDCTWVFPDRLASSKLALFR